METVFSDPQYQNELDAEMIYNTIEEEIVPKYYDRDADGIPRAWMASVKKCIAEIASNFTTNRMLRDYEVRFYNRLAARKRELSENDFAVAREIVAWKHKVLAAWPAVKIVDVQRARVGDKPIFIGRSYHFELTLDGPFLVFKSHRIAREHVDFCSRFRVRSLQLARNFLPVRDVLLKTAYLIAKRINRFVSTGIAFHPLLQFLNP